ncbi:MAG: hypothetical protein ACN6O8_05545 [Achromobacter sp.]|uniref:hypothetical protein n=1 Tax=Achromobacter sp. TaxID=134375 RepID=UPI003D07200E
MTTPTIWGRRSARNVQKVLWLAGELGLAHEHIPAGDQTRTRAGASLGASFTYPFSHPFFAT